MMLSLLFTEFRPAVFEIEAWIADNLLLQCMQFLLEEFIRIRHST